MASKIIRNHVKDVGRFVRDHVSASDVINNGPDVVDAAANYAPPLPGGGDDGEGGEPGSALEYKTAGGSTFGGDGVDNYPPPLPCSSDGGGEGESTFGQGAAVGYHNPAGGGGSIFGQGDNDVGYHNLASGGSTLGQGDDVGSHNPTGGSTFGQEAAVGYHNLAGGYPFGHGAAVGYHNPADGSPYGQELAGRFNAATGGAGGCG